MPCIADMTADGRGGRLLLGDLGYHADQIQWVPLASHADQIQTSGVMLVVPTASRQDSHSCELTVRRNVRACHAVSGRFHRVSAH